MKICIVTSSGGHLLKTLYLEKWWSSKKRFWVTKKDAFSQSLLKKEHTYWGFFPESRNVLNFFKNLLLAAYILHKEKPTMVFSTGAGIAPPFFLVAKIFGIKTVFIETFIFIPKATLSGKLIYFFTDYFFIQNEKLKKVFPKANYLGPIV